MEAKQYAERKSSFDKMRWDNLGDSFITLGSLLQQTMTKAITTEEQAQALYRTVYQQVCQFCSKSRWCWGEEAEYTAEVFSTACNQLAEQGLQKESVFSTKFQGRCSKGGQLEIAIFNQVALYYERMQTERLLQESKANISQQLMLLGEQMKLMRTANSSHDYPQRLIVGHACSKKETVSGDSWCVLDLQDGRLVQILCDGMGSGRLAMEQSNLALHLLKTLLSGGLSVRLSLNIMNTVLYIQNGQARFSTVDIAVWNLNTKKVELYKYGAAPSFVRNGKQVSTYMSESLPVGILSRVEGTATEHIIRHGDLLVMMSDGLYELTNGQFQWEHIIATMPTTNPQLMAEYLLAIATSRSRGNQKIAEQKQEQVRSVDDMTVVVSRLV